MINRIISEKHYECIYVLKEGVKHVERRKLQITKDAWVNKQFIAPLSIGNSFILLSLKKYQPLLPNPKFIQSSRSLVQFSRYSIALSLSQLQFILTLALQNYNSTVKQSSNFLQLKCYTLGGRDFRICVTLFDDLQSISSQFASHCCPVKVVSELYFVSGVS